MKKMTFAQVSAAFYKHNENRVTTQFGDNERLTAVVVFKKENWPDKDFSEESRSYRFTSDNKCFVPGMCSSSIFADCLDGSDNVIRLDWYLNDWKIDYCYIEEK